MIAMKVLGTRQIEISKIDASTFRIRNDAGRAIEMVGSWRTTGQLNPVLVRPKDGSYELIAGHIRVRTAKLSGERFIEAKIVECDDREAWTIAVTENMARMDMNPIEKERAIAALWKLKWPSLKVMAQTIGIDRTYAGRLLSADEFRVKENISARIYTRTINDTEPLGDPRLRRLLLQEVENGNIAPNQVRAISRSLADRRGVLTKLNDEGVRTFFRNPRQLPPDEDEVIETHERSDYHYNRERFDRDLTRHAEDFLQAFDAEPDFAERRRIAEMVRNYLDGYAVEGSESRIWSPEQLKDENERPKARPDSHDGRRRRP